MKQTVQRLKEDIGICKVDEVSNSVFKEFLEICLLMPMTCKLYYGIFT